MLITWQERGDGKSLNFPSKDPHPQTAKARPLDSLLTKPQCHIGADQEVSGLPPLDDSETLTERGGVGGGKVEAWVGQVVTPPEWGGRDTFWGAE